MSIQDIINEVSPKLPAGYTVKIEIASDGAGVIAVLPNGDEIPVVAASITTAVMDAAGFCQGDAAAEAERK